MTCIEKLRELHPDWSEQKIARVVTDSCPNDYYIDKEPAYCLKTHDCPRCWDREVDEYLYEAPRWKESLFLKGDDIRRLDRLVECMSSDRSRIISAALEFYEATLNAINKGLDGNTYVSFVERYSDE